MTQTMQFLESNAKLPRGVVFNTVRHGEKWAQQAKVGDVLNLEVTESGHALGHACVVALETFPGLDATCEYAAAGNHENIGPETTDTHAGQVAALKSALQRAYPRAADQDMWTVVTLVCMNTGGG